MKKIFLFFAVVVAGICLSLSANAQKRTAKMKLGKICGNPQVKCRTGNASFQPHEIPFEIPKGGAVISGSEPFYAVFLKTVKLNSRVNCETAVSENERLQIQNLFPEHKAFALKCSEAGDIYYTNIADNINFIAVYAGKTLTEARNFLRTVQATGKFKSANLRRIQAQINGT